MNKIILDNQVLSDDESKRTSGLHITWRCTMNKKINNQYIYKILDPK